MNNNNNQGLLLRPKKSTMASKTNRYSCGDFSQLTTFSTPQLLMGHSHSFSDTAAGEFLIFGTFLISFLNKLKACFTNKTLFYSD